MATTSAIARPYAQAAYGYAVAKQELPLWENMLRMAAQCVQQPTISKLISNTRISPQQWFALFSNILAPYLDEHRKNFLRLIVENKRLYIMPAILDLFKEFEAMDNRAAEVQVTTAVALDDKYQQKLTDKLTKLLKHHVTLRCDVDANIVGGAIIRAGDKVIDGSVRGQLTRLLDFAIR